MKTLWLQPFTCLFAIMLAWSGGVSANAQQSSKQDQSSDSVPLVHRSTMVISPCKITEPAKAIRLTRSEGEWIEGNAAIAYYRAILFFLEIPMEQRDTAIASITKSLAVPSTKIDVDELNRHLTVFSRCMNAVADGSRKKQCEWSLTFFKKDPLQSINMRMPEFGHLRTISKLFIARAKIAANLGNYDEAVSHLKINNQLALHIAKMEPIIAGLVGIEMIQRSLDVIDDISAIEGSPNFHAALDLLVIPLVDMQSKIFAELDYWKSAFPVLVKPATTQRTQAEWRKMIVDTYVTSQMLANNQTDRDRVSSEHSANFDRIASVTYPLMLKELIGNGMSAESLDAMPVAQVIAIYTSQILEQSVAATKKQITQVTPEQKQPVTNLKNDIFQIADFFPAPVKAMQPANRLDRRIAVMRNIQAIRSYLATNESMFPNSLSEIEGVRTSNDPLTNKPFEYQAGRRSAILSRSYTNRQGVDVIEQVTLLKGK